MIDNKFIILFNHHKEEFLKDLEKELAAEPTANLDSINDFIIILNEFEKWLRKLYGN